MIIAFGWVFSGAGVFAGGSRRIVELVPKWDWFCFGKDGLRVLLEFIGTAWRVGFNLGIAACTIGLLR